MTGTYDAPWHLFYIEAECSDDDEWSTIKAWMISGQSESRQKAWELVEACLLDETEALYVTHHSYIGVIDRDVINPIGELAQ